LNQKKQNQQPMQKIDQNSNDLEKLPATMRAMVMDMAGQTLVMKDVPLPEPTAKQVLIKIIACGVCRTDLHIMDSELDQPKLPLILGHEIVGVVARLGPAVTLLKKGDLVGVPWLGYTCGTCKFCARGEENLCENALFTGYTLDGGYAEYTVAFEDYCFRLPLKYGNASGAPLLCAGLIGYRSYTMIAPGTKKLGIYGFGAAAHILIQVALHQGKRVYAFTRDGDIEAQQFALSLGAAWAGDSSSAPPEAMDSAIIFAPVGSLVPKALKDVDKGGRVICGGIHMSAIPSFPYELLWEERMLKSVANLTRKDGHDFIELANVIPITTTYRLFPLSEAHEALAAVRSGLIQGGAVLVM
jgi:propanol-preferring alcohol dehydrogenase